MTTRISHKYLFKVILVVGLDVTVWRWDDLVSCYAFNDIIHHSIASKWWWKKNLVLWETMITWRATEFGDMVETISPGEGGFKAGWTLLWLRVLVDGREAKACSRSPRISAWATVSSDNYTLLPGNVFGSLTDNGEHRVVPPSVSRWCCEHRSTMDDGAVSITVTEITTWSCGYQAYHDDTFICCLR